MSRIRPGWIAGATVLTAVVVITVAWLTQRSGSDCDTVRDMLTYNRTHNTQVARESDGDALAETSEHGYAAWAARLRGYTDGVSDPELARDVGRLADIADATVSVVRDARDDSVLSATTGPPTWVSEYARLHRDFEAEAAILAARCPG